MRKQIKTWAVLGLAAALTASMAGCASSQSGSSETAAPQAPAAPQDPDKAQTAETTKTEGSEAPAAALEGEIEIVTNGNEETFNAVNEILNNFMAENPGVTISYTTQGSDYEQLMKARMASNDLPDIFATHGWSVARYSEYLTPLNDQPWYGSIEESFMNNLAISFQVSYTLDISGKLILLIDPFYDPFAAPQEDIKHIRYPLLRGVFHAKCNHPIYIHHVHWSEGIFPISGF